LAVANLPLMRLSAATRPTKSSTTAVIAGFPSQPVVQRLVCRHFAARWFHGVTAAQRQ